MNPFYIYILSFLGVILVYLLNWSNLYSSLSLSTIIFFAISFLIAGLLGKKAITDKEFKYKDISNNNKLKHISIGIFIMYIVEFIYVGGAPLITPGMHYLEFQGIPMVHVFLFTFTIFYGVYLFHCYISTKNKFTLLLYILNFIPAMLIISRGMIINIVVGSFFVLLSKIGLKKIVNRKYIIGIFIFIITTFYIFGILGNIRVSMSDNRYNNFSSEYIMDIGGASKEFRNSIIPKPFFWSYIYVSSPLANLQKNIDGGKHRITPTDYYYFFLREIIPDIIARRLSDEVAFDLGNYVKLIKPELIVGTSFLGGFYYLGWYGIIGIFIYLMLIIYLYIKLLGKDNKFRTVGIAMLCNIIILNTFSNIIVFAGMSMQLLYPLLYRIYLVCKGYINEKKSIK